MTFTKSMIHEIKSGSIIYKRVKFLFLKIKNVQILQAGKEIYGHVFNI